MNSHRPDLGRTSLSRGLRGVATDRRIVSAPWGVLGLRPCRARDKQLDLDTMNPPTETLITSLLKKESLT